MTVCEIVFVQILELVFVVAFDLHRIAEFFTVSVKLYAYFRSLCSISVDPCLGSLNFDLFLLDGVRDVVRFFLIV